MEVLNLFDLRELKLVFSPLRLTRISPGFGDPPFAAEIPMSCRDRKAALDPLAARDSQPRISDCRKNLQDVLQGVLRCPCFIMFHHVSCNVHYDKHDKCVCVCRSFWILNHVRSIGHQCDTKENSNIVSFHVPSCR